jgi:diguanylate cyclase (GGDEF)-like protein
MTSIEPYLDSATVLLFALFTRLLLAILFFGFWFRSRRSVWFLWWSASLLLGCAGASIIIARGFLAEFFGLGIAVACLIASLGSCWTGARVFERRRPLWSPVLAAMAVWLAASLMPSVFQPTANRVALSSLLLGVFPALTAFEFWRGRTERLPSRWVIIALFASLSAVFFIRIPLVGIAPFPFGAQPAHIVWTSAFNMALFFHTVILVVLLVALTKERLELEQRMAAYTDALTGASNRRAFTVRGRRLLSRHERNRHELCVLFLDIDDFKQINDRFGHAGGDAVLKRFVEIVLDNIRPTDFLFRIGGEEFCCLLPQTGLQQGEHVAERIRSHVEKATFDVARAQARSTVSIGVASTASAGYDLDVLVHAADEAVYAAKRQGRNQVVVSGVLEDALVMKLARHALKS